MSRYPKSSAVVQEKKKKKKKVESSEDEDSGVGSEVEDVSDASGGDLAACSSSS